MDESNREPMRVLIVDDDADLARSTALILKCKGFTTSIATSGLVALHQAEQQSFDVVLLDIRMPGMDGVETYQRLKTIQPDLIAIMMTGFALEERVQASLREGALTVFTKPLALDHLLQLLEDAIAHRRALALVVDDYPDTCVMLDALLKRKGYRVARAETGEQAIARIKERQPDIVFLDLKLPTIDGLQTFQHIRQIAPLVTIVMMTGYRDEMNALVETALRASAFACLYKPFSADQVLTVLDAVKARMKDERRLLTADR